MNIVCKDAWQKITVDEWDVDPHDMKMTVKCLPTFKYDLPSENFPKVNLLSSKNKILICCKNIIVAKVSKLLPGAWSDMEQHRYGRHHRPASSSNIFTLIFVVIIILTIILIMIVNRESLH